MSHPEFLEPGSRLSRQIAFLMELDKLKSVLRRSLLSHENRRENSGEHSWHVTVVALVLAEYADHPLDLSRVLRMLLVHDVVEIDAGDVYIYDLQANSGKKEREIEAANRLFGLLPPDQAQEMRTLWDEFEAQKTAEARFAAACDRLIPLLHNVYAKGHSWQENGVVLRDVYEVNSVIANGSSKLWEAAKTVIDASVEMGYLKKSK